MTQSSVVRMANQIALNVPDRANAAAATATHIRTFWAPSLIEELQAEVDDDPTCVNDIVLAALAAISPIEALHD
jgi:predicted secreted protein